MRDCRWNTRSRLTEGSPYEHLSYSLGTRIKESRDFPPGLVVEVQRHGLKLKRQGRDYTEDFTAMDPPGSMTGGIEELEAPPEGRRRNASDDFFVVASQQTWTLLALPPTVDRDYQIVDVREQR